MKFTVNHIAEHLAHGTHNIMEERSYPGILASDILVSVGTGQSSHHLKEMYVLGDEPSIGRSRTRVSPILADMFPVNGVECAWSSLHGLHDKQRKCAIQTIIIK